MIHNNTLFNIYSLIQLNIYKDKYKFIFNLKLY